MKKIVMKRLKENQAFSRGMIAVLAVALLVGSVSAAAGQVSYNQIGIRLFGESKVTAGESFKAANGQEVPSVITYTDAAGGKTNYLSVRQISELLDAEVAWNAETNSVDFATWNGPDVEPRVDIIRIEAGEEVPSPYPNKAELGVTHGAFTEIDPSTVDTSSEPASTLLKDTRITADRTGFPALSYGFHPAAGKYVVFQVTNNGTTAQAVTVERMKPVSYDRTEPFTTVTLAPGQTVTRAFSISSDSTQLERALEFGADPIDRPNGIDITVSLMQYR